MGKFCKKEAPKREGAKGGAKPPADAFAAAHPALVEYVSEARWEDGSARELATVIVFFEEGRWKACVNDKAMERTGWASGASWDGLWDAVEAGLAGGSLDWRASRKGGRK